MGFNYSGRLLIGLLLVTIVSITYLLNLDYFLLFLILALITYDFYIVKISKNYYIFLLLITTLIVIFFCPNYIFQYLYLLEIILVLLIFFISKFKSHFFLLSIYIFCIILFYIISVNRDLFYIIIFISFFNDTIAYIFGKNIGGPLITPKISPNKTWSGTSISLFLSTAVLFFLGFNILFSLIISFFLFLGDIFFSYIKRYFNIKDFSPILGAHGGILDRLDSMFFVVIIFQIYLVKFI